MLHIFTEGPFFQPDSDDEEEYMDFNCDDSVIFKDQSYFADQKMETLDEKIQNKTHALKAIRESRTAEDSKVGLEEYNSGFLLIILLSVHVFCDLKKFVQMVLIFVQSTWKFYKSHV